MTRSELIGKVKRTDTPLLGLAATCSLCIVTISCLLIDDSLGVLEGHRAWAGSFWSGSALIGSLIDVEMFHISLELLIVNLSHIVHVSLLLIELRLLNMTIDSLRGCFS